MEVWFKTLRSKCAPTGMPEEISAPVKPNVSASSISRGIKTGPPIDQNSKTLHAFQPVVPESPAKAAPDETHQRAAEATYQLPPDGGLATTETPLSASTQPNPIEPTLV